MSGALAMWGSYRVCVEGIVFRGLEIRAKIWDNIGVVWGYQEMMEKKMEGSGFRVSQSWGCLFGGPNYMDEGILGSLLESPYFGKLPC